MPRLEEQEKKKLYFFYSEKTGRKLRKFSNDKVSLEEVSEFQIPDFLLEQPERNEYSKKREGIRENPSNKING